MDKYKHSYKSIQQTSSIKPPTVEYVGKGIDSKYPKYFRDVSTINSIDVYAVHSLFQINDPSGCIQHASKKLLLSGSRNGGKTMIQDVAEARDSLNRWLEINKQ